MGHSYRLRHTDSDDKTTTNAGDITVHVHGTEHPDDTARKVVANLKARGDKPKQTGKDSK